jgi:hypothetical protein
MSAAATSPEQERRAAEARATAAAQNRARIAAIFGELAALNAELCRLMGGDPSAANGPVTADDETLDGPYGDPEVRFDPHEWKGTLRKGHKYSRCPSDYLIALAQGLEWTAANPTAKNAKYANRNRRDASLARGWAKRNEGKDFKPAGPPALGGSTAAGRNVTAPPPGHRPPPPASGPRPVPPPLGRPASSVPTAAAAAAASSASPGDRQEPSSSSDGWPDNDADADDDDQWNGKGGET